MNEVDGRDNATDAMDSISTGHITGFVFGESSDSPARSHEAGG
jgi:hypothetical protein